MFKKMDLAIIVILIVLSFLPEIIFIKVNSKKKNIYAEVTVNGEVYKKFNLSAHKGEDRINIDNNGHMNQLLINNNSIEIIDANCPDKYCIQDGEISKSGEILVCLPNKLVVEVKGSNIEDEIFSIH